MCNVARTQVEAQNREKANENLQPIGDEFEQYIGELGMMQVDTITQSLADPAGAFQGEPGASTAEIIDWFSGNQTAAEIPDKYPEFDAADWGI